MKIIDKPNVVINGKKIDVDFDSDCLTSKVTKDILEDYINTKYQSQYDFSYQVRKNIRQHIEVEIFKIIPTGTVINHCVYKTYQEAIEDFSNLFDHFLRNFYQSVNDNLINPIMENVEIKIPF
jgi:hypothetical protein